MWLKCPTSVRCNKPKVSTDQVLNSSHGMISMSLTSIDGHGEKLRYKSLMYKERILLKLHCLYVQSNDVQARNDGA